MYIRKMPAQTIKRIHNYWYVLTAQIFLIFIGGFMEERPLLYFLFAFSLFFIYGSIIKTIWQKRSFRIVGLGIGVLAIIFSVISFFIPDYFKETLFDFLVLVAFSYALFILLAIIAIGRFVFITDKVTVNRIVGSVCVYLLIGMFFTFVYTGLGIMMPDGFNLRGETMGKIEAFRDYLYFSFVTLTTTGYGDMLPMLPTTKMVAIMESIIGPIYLAVMIARLVGMHISQEVKKSIRK